MDNGRQQYEKERIEVETERDEYIVSEGLYMFLRGRDMSRK